MITLPIRKTRSPLGHVFLKNRTPLHNLFAEKASVRKDPEKKEITFVLDLSGNRRSSFCNTVDDYNSLVEYREDLGEINITDDHTLGQMEAFISHNSDSRFFIEFILGSGIDSLRLPLKGNCEWDKRSRVLTITFPPDTQVE